MARDLTRRNALKGAGTLAALASLTGTNAYAESTRPKARLQDLYPNPRGLKMPGRYYYAQGTVFTRDVSGSDFPVDPRTPEFRKTIIEMPKSYGHPEITSHEDYARNIPIWITDTRKSGYSTIHMKQQTNEAMQAVNTGTIPAPPFVSAAWGADREMALYDLGSGYMRDYYICDNDGKGNWTAVGGGFSRANPGLTDLSKTNFWMQLTKVKNGNGVMATGSAAVVAMHTEASQVGLNEALYGRIDHAVGFMMANSAPGFSFPAQQGDGYWTQSPAPVEGQWFRIPPNVNLRDMGLGPFVLDICLALQRYGGYAIDRNAAVHAVIYDSPFYDLSVDKVDPWKAIFASRGVDSVYPWDMPWNLIEWAVPDWKGTRQAEPIAPPLHYNTSDWKITTSGGFNKPLTQTAIGMLSLRCFDKPSSAGTVTFSSTMTLSKSTTYVLPTSTKPGNTMTTMTASVDGKVLSTAKSRGATGHSLRFTVPAGTHRVDLTLHMPDSGADGILMQGLEEV